MRYRLSPDGDGGQLRVLPVHHGKPVALPPRTQAQLDAAMRRVPGARQGDTWRVPLAAHDAARDALVAARLDCDEIHPHLLAVLRRPKVQPWSEARVREAMGDAFFDDLMESQQRAVAFFAARGGRGLCGDEMGCGKTRTALALYYCFRHEGRLVVVCPASLKKNWVAEAVAAGYFTRAEIQDVRKGYVKDKATGRQVLTPIRDDARLVLFSYGMLTKYKRLDGVRLMVLDESHAVKNPEANCTKHVFKHMVRACKIPVLSMSGTLMDRPCDMFSQLKLVDETIVPGPLLPWRGRLRAGEFSYGFTFCAPEEVHISRHETRWEARGSDRLPLLNAVLQGVMLRRTSRQVLDLPEKVRREIVLSEEDGDLLERALGEMAALKEERGKRASNTKFNELMLETMRLKVPHVCRYVREQLAAELAADPKKKVILFGQFMEMLDPVEDELRDRGLGYVRLDGGVQMEKRQGLVDRFNADDGVQVALMGVKVGRAGYNMQACATVVFLEMFFSPSDHLQGEARAWRKGQAAARVECRYLVSKNTTDDILWRTVCKKHRNAGAALDGKKTHLGMKRARDDDGDDGDDDNGQQPKRRQRQGPPPTDLTGMF